VQLQDVLYTTFIQGEMGRWKRWWTSSCQTWTAGFREIQVL